MNSKNKVFVYGSLKKGFKNHFLLSDSEYIGSGHTVEKYALYIDKISFVYKKKPVSVIYGEIYLVDANTLANLDRLQYQPTWYYRELVEIMIDGLDSIEICWIYFFSNQQGSLVESGKYEF